MAAPVTHYVKSDDVHIAYQVVGDGPLDLLFVPGFVSHIEATWDSPVRSSFFRRLASFSRLILFDKRGTGMSDRGSQIFTLEQRMHDVRTILDEVGSERAALFGVSEGGPMSLLYAATYPQRTSALILYGSYAKRSWAPDYPLGWDDEQWQRFLENIERNWGTPKGISIEMWAPSLARDPNAAERLASYFRTAASPGAAAAIMKMNREIDVRHVLPAISTPTLILHRVGDRVFDVEHARRMAQGIPGAQLVELPGTDHTFWVNDGGLLLDHVEQFLTGKHHAQDRERVLATVLFADIVGSPSELSRLVIVRGANCSRHSVQKFGIRCETSTGARSILRAMVSLRPSTARRERSAARVRSAKQRARSASKSAADCTPGNANWSVKT